MIVNFFAYLKFADGGKFRKIWDDVDIVNFC